MHSQTDSSNVRDLHHDGEKTVYIIGTGPDSTLLFLNTSDEEKLGIKSSTQGTDTLLDNLHNYYQVGVLGNLGLPSYSLLAEDNSTSGFFKWMKLNNRNDLFTNKQPVYFYPEGKVYTRVFAAMGQKLEQVFKILHSQNIKRVNVSLQFNRYSCLGFYLNQKSITDNFLFSSHASTKKGRLGYHFYFLYNKLKYQLNGGIDTSKVRFEENILVQKQLFPVMLSTTKHNIRTSEVNFSTFLKLNKDSLGALHFLEYESNYQGNYWFQTDGFADSARYNNNFYYSTDGINKDSISFKSFTNSFSYKLNVKGPYDRNKFVFYAGYKNEFNHYNQFTYDTMTMNHILIGGIRGNSDGGIMSLSGQYVASGFNAGNYSFRMNATTDTDRKLFFSFDMNFRKEMPDYMSIVYFSPHFIWSDTFKNVSTQNAKIEFGSNKYRVKLGAFAQAQSNPIYFDTLALPKQYGDSTFLIRLYAQKDLKLGPVHFNNVFNYQYTSNTDIIRLPTYYTSHQLYYEGKLFKKALWLQVGLQARYISSFKANAYMPATNQFYLQNKQEYGNYVFADFFINAQIERFRFFILASHINQGLSGANYMLCPNYAMPDRSIKAGLTWMFFD